MKEGRTITFKVECGSLAGIEGNDQILQADIGEKHKFAINVAWAEHINLD